MASKLKSAGPYSLARWAGNLMFISGQLPINPETNKLERGFKKQCERTLSNIQLILEDEGLNLNDIVKLTVIVDDLADFSQVNKVFEDVFDEPYPSRTTFEASGLPKNALVEIEAIALKNSN